MKKFLVYGLLLPAAVLVVLFLVGFMVLVVMLAPPVVSGVSLALLALAGVWFFVVRRGSGGPVSEGSLMGRQTSKEGLL